MISLTMSQIANATGGQLIGDDIEVSNVLTDSRIKKSELENNNSIFIALRGPHFDAHQFVDNVIDIGVKGVIVEKQCNIFQPQIIVKDTRIALAEIARLNRERSNAKYIGVTGSSGKTTVKEMIASVLALAGKTHATKGNFNNDIGVPLTLLDIDRNVSYAVIELGANHKGEIAFTADIAKPDVALVNNITEAHLQGFGDIQGVASAKSEIYSSLSPDGVAIVNADDKFYRYFENKISGKKLSYAVNSEADIYASNVQFNADQSSSFTLNYQQQKIEVQLPLVGAHNISNALAAASCCIAVGISLDKISSGLQKTPLVAGRLIVNMLSNGCRLIDDTYNANVASMMAAIDLLKSYPEPTFLVIGDMGELGELGRQCHEQIGEYANQAGVSQMFSCGVLTQFAQIAFNKKNVVKDKKTFDINTQKLTNHFSQQKELIIKLKNEMTTDATILIKGSRGAHMENIVKALKECYGNEVPFHQEPNKKDKCTASFVGEQ